MKTPVVSSEWLNKNLNNKNIVILDASQQIEDASYSILGARYFDIKNEFSAIDRFPNTFPSATQFELACQKLGINKDSEIVVYDNKGVFSSPRVWWMFRSMGHQNISVLDGGLPDWLAKDYAAQSDFNVEFQKGNFVSNLNMNNVKYFDFVCENIKTKNELLIDARSSGRFDGVTPEPREGLRSGHIPNSINLPYTEVLEGGKFKSLPLLKEVFAKLELENKPLFFTCGSGITACIILLASQLIMNYSVSIYDGSWTEFASLQEE